MIYFAIICDRVCSYILSTIRYTLACVHACATRLPPRNCVCTLCVMWFYNCNKNVIHPRRCYIFCICSRWSFARSALAHEQSRKVDWISNSLFLISHFLAQNCAIELWRLLQLFAISLSVTNTVALFFLSHFRENWFRKIDSRKHLSKNIFVRFFFTSRSYRICTDATQLRDIL